MMQLKQEGKKKGRIVLVMHEIIAIHFLYCVQDNDHRCRNVFAPVSLINGAVLMHSCLVK